MKALFWKVLRFLGVDLFVVGLVERLTLGLIKKLTALREVTLDVLDRLEKERTDRVSDR